MNQIQIFNNPQFGEIRTAGTSEQPAFCLVDVCTALNLSPSKVGQRIEDDVLSKYPIVDALGREQIANFINEDGLYDVILDSRKPAAKQFRKWITSEVIPSIRKNGGYIATNESDTPETIMAKALLIADETMKKQKALIDQQQATIRQQGPRVLFAQAVETSNRSILIGELAKILNQNGINIGQNRLFEVLRTNCYLGQRGEFYNIPSQKSMELGLFEIKKTTISKPDGTTLVSTTTKVTGKGQIYFVNKFLKHFQGLKQAQSI